VSALFAPFEERARCQPERVALKDSQHVLTFHALNLSANRVAHALLAALGAGEGRVGVLTGQDAPRIAALFGVLKAGKTFVAVDPSNPRERVREVLADCGAGLVLADDAHFDAARDLAGPACPLLNLDEAVATGPAGNPGLGIPADLPAFLVYTSGSTGRPKGIVVSNGAQLSRQGHHVSAPPVAGEDRVALLLSSSGIGATLAIAFLSVGASVYPCDVRRQGFADLAAWLQREEITVYWSTVSVLRHFLDTLGVTVRFPSLRLAHFGSEPLTRREVERFRGHLSGACVLANNYAAAEAGSATRYLIGENTQLEGDSVPIGRPFGDVDVLLLDESDREVAMGEAGEIVLGGPSVASGYWRQPELTRATFRPGRADRLGNHYWTGDLGMRQPDGNLLYVGRKDFRFKVRGYRVELAEIKATLRLHPAVHEAAAVARDPGDGEQLLFAYVVPAPGIPLVARDLRAFLVDRLPDYMIPSEIVTMAALPLTALGKVDRQALPLPESPPYAARTSRPEARDRLEERLAGIWAEVLGLEHVGRGEDFFELGGHSLQAAQVLVKVERVFGRRLAPSIFFQARTVEELARVLRDSGPVRFDRPLLAIQPGGSSPPFFCDGGPGNVFPLYDLATSLGPGQLFYGLQVAGLDAGPRSVFSIEEMAHRFLEEIRPVPPRGPYLLGGLCFGALVAYEMARQLREAGERVGLLALLDTPAPGALDSSLVRRSRRLGILERVKIHWGRAGAVKSRRMYLAYLGVRAREEALIRLGLRWFVGTKAIRAARGYSPGAYPGEMTLFVVEEGAHRPLLGPCFGWDRTALERVEVRPTPGTHADFSQGPNARALAESLRRCIAAARAAERWDGS
jgi:amino acid adenylation domain-containing protein